MTGLADKSSTT